MHIARSACFSMVLEIVEIKLERKICYLLLQKIYTILFLMIISKKKIGIFRDIVVARYFLLTIRNCSQFQFFYSFVAVYLLHLNLSISLIKSCFNKLLTDRS